MTVLSAPCERLLSVATAVALWRGGIVDCGRLVDRLRRALIEAEHWSPELRLVGVVAASRAVVDARSCADAVAFDEAKCRLWAAVAAYWCREAMAV